MHWNKLHLVKGDSPGEWGYSRCGRTDRGVSALGNVNNLLNYLGFCC